MKALIYAPDGDGKAKVEDIPADMAEAAKAAHEALVEMVAEIDDELMQEFFDKGTLPLEDLKKGLREAVLEKRMYPGSCQLRAAQYRQRRDSRFHRRNISRLPPSAAKLLLTKNLRARAKPSSAPLATKEPLSLFVFKTLADTFAGRISYFKVMSGVLNNDANVANFNRNTVERFQHLEIRQGKTATAINELHAGDIGTIAKLKDTTTGETLGDKSAPIYYPPAHLPEPSITFADRAEDARRRRPHRRRHSPNSRRRSRAAFLAATRRPRNFCSRARDSSTSKWSSPNCASATTLTSRCNPPKVAYRETIRAKADAEGKHKKQTGGHGQFGVCRIKMEPLPRGSGFEFVDDVFGGAIPKNWIPSVEKGIRDASERGFLAGFPVVDFRASLYDGKYHDVDSSDMAFKIAGALAFKEAMKQAKPALLEPIMKVEVYAPDQYSGDIMGNISSRRGHISGSETRGQNVVVQARRFRSRRCSATRTI